MDKIAIFKKCPKSIFTNKNGSKNYIYLSLNKNNIHTIKYQCVMHIKI